MPSSARQLYRAWATRMNRMGNVILDGYTENLGDLSWLPIEALGKVTVDDRTDVKDEALIRQRIMDMIAQNIAAWQAGQPVHVVNP